MSALTLSLTYEERAQRARKYKIDDPNSLTADAIVDDEVEFAERRRARDGSASLTNATQQGCQPVDTVRAWAP